MDGGECIFFLPQTRQLLIERDINLTKYVQALMDNTGHWVAS